MNRMNWRPRALTLVALAVGGLLLTGCEPVVASGTESISQSGCDPSGMPGINGCSDVSPAKSDSSGSNSSENSDCDPNGFGPLSGCSSGQGGQKADTFTGTGPDALPQSFYWRARHEAGHKRCAQELGMHVWSVWLHANGEGRTNIFGFKSKDPQQRLVVLYCGSVAAGTTEGTVGESSDGAPGDLDQIEDITSNPSIDSDAAMLEAQHIVRTHASQIDHDATELLNNGSL